MAVDVSAPLPQLDLTEGTLVTVTLDHPTAIITSLAVHGWQENPAPGIEPPPILLAVQPEPAP